VNKTPRRIDNQHEVWTEERRSGESDLRIPPCELWYADESKASGESNTVTKVSNDHRPLVKPPSEFKPQCWAFMGAVGGVGTTTLAVQMAFELAKKQSRQEGRPSRITDSQVCIVDLDFESGGCIHQLDVAPGLTLDDLTGDAMRIDSSITEAFLNTHGSGISLLAAPNMIGANARVNTETVLALLDAASTMFPYVILDMPRQWQPWSLAAIGGSDFTGLICDLTIPSFHMARAKRDQLGEFFPYENPCKIILNKYERRSFKNTLQLHDAEMALQCELFGKVCEDASVTQEAINCGEPVGAIRANSRYAKDSRKLLDQILSMTHAKHELKIKAQK